MRTAPRPERFQRVQGPDWAIEERQIARARKGDLGAFNWLVEHHQRTLFAIAVRMLAEPGAAADATQDAVLAAWQRLSDFHGGSFRAWVTRILVNRCYDVLRARQRHPDKSYDAMLQDAPESDQLAGEAPDPEQLVLTGELGRYLESGLAVLPPDQRAVVILCDVQGYTYAEAAEVERTQVGTIKSRLSRGRSRLRDWLAARPELLPTPTRSVFERDSEGAR